MNIPPKDVDPTKTVYLDDNIEAAGLFEDVFNNFAAINLREPGWNEKLVLALAGAELIITDWNLEWLHNDPLLPGDGKALNEVLRARQRKNPENPLYTIFSGKLSDVPDLEHHADRPHILAQDLDADWVGSKDKGPEFRRQLLLLCQARRVLREQPPPPEKISEYWGSLFGLEPGNKWADEALNEVDRLQPPIQHLYGAERDERILLRWMTRLILPYPTFLLDSYEVAVRLRLEPKGVAAQLSDDASPLSAALLPCRYSGILAGFNEQRWWRAGVADCLWNLTDGSPFDRERVRNALMAIVEGQVSFLEQRAPVLVRDERGRPIEDDLIVDVSQAVRIQPDEWPASVSWPWSPIELVLKDPILRAIVLPDDQHLLARNR